MRVNGKQLELTSPVTIEELILSSGYDKERVAVELNGKIVPRTEYCDIILKNEDSLEIVGFVGGG